MIRRYRVSVDDPDMSREFRFRLWAMNDWTARRGAARLAILLDGAIGVPPVPGVPYTRQRPKLRYRIQQAHSSDILNAVAYYAVVIG